MRPCHGRGLRGIIRVGEVGGLGTESLTGRVSIFSLWLCLRGGVVIKSCLKLEILNRDTNP
jgi:hypothetical protein